MEMTNSKPSTTNGLTLYTTCNMKHDDRPSINSLRDTLFRKIEHSKLMHFDISRYRTFDEGHPEKTYDFLLNMIKGYIARGKQERLLKDRERAVKMSLTSNKTTPALEDDVRTAAPTKTKKEDAAAASSAGDPPKGKPKAKAKSEAALSFLHLLRSPMPTRTRKARAKAGKEDHHHPLTRRRYSAITSSIKVDVTKVTSVSTVILRKSMMPR